MVESQHRDQGTFDGAPETHAFDGFLFDLDGTIIDSTSAIVKAWHKIAAELDVDPNAILATSHGRRTIDTIRQYDESKANWEYIKDMEGKIPYEFGPDATTVPGARAVLERMTSLSAPWAVVTSGTRPLMAGWLDVMKMPEPAVSVTAEDVESGKPDPSCYRLGRQRIGLDASARILVVEDAPAGVRAGKAAGCMVLGLATTHSIDKVRQAGADWVVKDLESIKVTRGDVPAATATSTADATTAANWTVVIENTWQAAANR